ncbi:MAG: hypothetical protein JSS76_17500 [Bacteroidetes bacterium]|nr:hypothetical protein [Bacteroidota bacterium]
MRKAAAILVLILYILSSSGVAVKAHYCCGKLKSLNLVLNSDEERNCSKKCCRDKLAFYKVSDTENSTSIITFNPSFDKIFYQVSYIVKTCIEPYPTTPVVSELACASDPPPAHRDILASIRVFRI